MTLPDGIEPDQLKTAAVAVLVILVVLLFLVTRLIQKMVMRVIVAGVLIAAGAFIYAQRDDLDACQQQIRAQMTETRADVKCTCDFAGLEVTVPQCPLARGPDSS